MFDDLIEYEQLTEACAEAFAFSGVTFLRDFGPWKAGAYVPHLWFLLDSANFEAYAEDGQTITHSGKFCLSYGN